MSGGAPGTFWMGVVGPLLGIEPSQGFGPAASIAGAGARCPRRHPVGPPVTRGVDLYRSVTSAA